MDGGFEGGENEMVRCWGRWKDGVPEKRAEPGFEQGELRGGYGGETESEG